MTTATPELLREIAAHIRSDAETLRECHATPPEFDLGTMEPEVREVYERELRYAAVIEGLAERMGQEPVAWEHHYRKITGGRSYVQADCGGPDIHPDPDEGYEWLRATPLYAAPQPTPEDVRDARRYRIIKGMADRQLVGFMDRPQPHTSTDAMLYMPNATEMDDAADAAMQQEQPK